MRSKFKLPYIHPFLWKNSMYSNSKVVTFKTKTRSTSLHPLLFNVTFRVYNGKAFYDIPINSFMSLHKLGEFIFTRKKCIFRNKKKAKKKIFRKKK